MRRADPDSYIAVDTTWIFACRDDPWPGAYIITHLGTGKFYIGSSSNLYKRKLNHESQLRQGRHDNAGLQEIYNQSTQMYFSYWISADIEQAKTWEQILLDRHWGDPLLLNGTSHATKSSLGIPNFSERMKDWANAHWNTPEGAAHRAKVSEMSKAKAKRVSIDGVIYNSVPEAAEKLNMPPARIYQRIRYHNSSYRATWFFLED
jgi:predicted GIY-YIG superfamily endonuclease